MLCCLLEHRKKLSYLISMASSNPFLSASLSLVCFVFFLSFEKKIFVSAIRVEPTGLQNTHHRVPLTSLFPSSSCSSPPQGAKKKGSSEVVHKHGPCSKLKHQSSSLASTVKGPLMIPHSEILKQDEARVRSIHYKLSRTQDSDEDEDEGEGLERVLGQGDYLVRVGLGTPTREMSLIFDTATDLTWTQCEPCLDCYDQTQPIFDPSLSSSFSNVSCSSPLCSQLQLSPIPDDTDIYLGVARKSGCYIFGNCAYVALHKDVYISIGVFGRETLTVTPTDVVNNFLFGCGLYSRVLFNGSTDGVLGLGLGLSHDSNPVSFIEQTADMFHKIFSYCIPSTSSTVGYLNFGDASASENISYTPFSSISQETSFYGVNVIGIALSGTDLSISPSVFSFGMIIDSGSVITRLPPAAYGPLRDAFGDVMSRYPKADPMSIMDTCYDLSGYKTVVVPKVKLSFEGGVDVELDASAVLYVVSETQVCLAFAANEQESNVAILGNAQQKTLEVVYDVEGGKIGFRPGGCT